MTLAFVVVLAFLGVLGTALVTFQRIDVVAFPATLYADEQEVDSVTTRTAFTRQRTVLTNFRIIQAEKRYPMGLLSGQHSARAVDLREVDSVLIVQGMSLPSLLFAVLMAILVLPLGWLFFVAALIYRVDALEFRTNTLRVRVLALQRGTAGLVRFLGAVQRQARADKGLPQVLQQTPQGWDLPSAGWFDLDRSALIAIAVLVAVPVGQYLLRGCASVGDAPLGGLLIAMPAIVGARRGALAGAAVGLLGTGGLLAGLCPLPLLNTVVPGPVQLLAAGLMLGLIGLAGGVLARLHPALASLAVLMWLLLPAPFDMSLYQMSLLYISVAAGGAISAGTLAVFSMGGVRRRTKPVSPKPKAPETPLPPSVSRPGGAPPTPPHVGARSTAPAIDRDIKPIFYVADGDKTVGPVSGAFLRRAVEAGKVTTTAFVWTAGWDEWRNVTELATMLGQFQSARSPALFNGAGIEALGKPTLPPPGSPKRRGK